MYSLTLLQRSLRVGLGANQSLQTRFNRISEILGQQVATLLTATERVLYRWSPPPALPPLDQEIDQEEPAPPQSCYPDPPILNLDENNSRLSLTLRRCISGTITLAASIPNLTLIDSIIDARAIQPADQDENITENLNQQQAIAAPGTALAVKTCTIFGTTTVRTVEAEESLFLGKLTSQRRQVGEMRFCYVPAGSRTPPRFRCQPDLTLLNHGTLPVAIVTLPRHPVTGELWAGTAGQGVYRLIPDSQIWVPIATGLTNLNITALIAIAPPGSGTIATQSALDAAGNPVTRVQGSGTAFLQELQVGDAIAVNTELCTVRAILSDTELHLEIPFSTELPDGTAFLRPALIAGTSGGKIWRATTVWSQGSGLLSSTAPDVNHGAIVVGCGTEFAANMVGVTLMVGDQRRQIRRVDSLTQQIQIDAAFAQNLVGADFLLDRGERIEAGQGTINATRDRTIVTGCGTQFQSQVILGDTLIVGNQTRTVIAVEANLLQVSPAWDENLIHTPYRIARTVWQPVLTPVLDDATGKSVSRNTDLQAIASYTRPGIGKISSRGLTVTGQDSLFSLDLSGVNLLTAAGQTRHIVAIATDGNTLTVNAPFDPELTTPTAFQIDGVLAGTAGGGVLRSCDGGQTWSAINQGLTHLDIRAIATDPDGLLWVGTWGGGVFGSSDGGRTWGGGDPPDREIRQTGLTNAEITALFVSPTSRAIFAATASGVFGSTDGGHRWQLMNSGLTNCQVTALAGISLPGRGTIASDYTTLWGTGTAFQLDLKPGDALIARGQVRNVVAIQSDRELRLNQPFDPDLPAGTPFTVTTLFAGTTGGSLFRSTNEGETWVAAGSGLSNTDLTCLTADVLPEGVLLAGTQIGSVFQSLNRGDLWATLNQGLSQVDTMLLLNQIQPRFVGDRYGQPGYAQLDVNCAIEIRTGAENGSEMGVFQALQQAQREDNLRASLIEYLRFGIQPDLIYFT
jgi:photosystem II stability/assembly factor-like uncharacterized protein